LSDKPANANEVQKEETVTIASVEAKDSKPE